MFTLPIMDFARDLEILLSNFFSSTQITEYLLSVYKHFDCFCLIFPFSFLYKNRLF